MKWKSSQMPWSEGRNGQIKLWQKDKSRIKPEKHWASKYMDPVEGGYIDQELFSLSAIKEKKELVAVDNNEFDDDAGDMGDRKSEESHDAEGYTSSDLDSKEERKRYDECVEKLLDEAYEHFVTKKEGSSKQRKRSKQKHKEDDNQLMEGDGDSKFHSDQNSDNDGAHHE